jgi:hypothetical protein
LRFLYPSGVSTLKELGRAMIYVSMHGFDKPILDVKDIVTVGK